MLTANQLGRALLFHRTGRKLLHHPVVGDLDLTYEALEVTSAPGRTQAPTEASS